MRLVSKLKALCVTQIWILALALLCSPLAAFAQGQDPLEQTLAAPQSSPATAYTTDSTVPGTADALAVPPAKSLTTTSLWDTVKQGGLAMIPLGALSVVLVALVLVFMVTLRRGAVVTPRYMATVDALLRKKDYLGLLAVSNRHNEAVARIVQRTLDFATKNPTANYEQIREIAETEGTRQASALNQQITYLADIGAIAPMVGLLGTVMGMIKSFTVLSAGMVASERSALLAAGISEALIATAAGLLIGIPAMGFYALFRGKVQKLTADLESAATQVLAILALHYAAIANSSRRVRREELITEDDF